MKAVARVEPGSQPLENARHERFALEYLIDRNGSASYQRAGYRSTGNAAEACALKLLRKTQVRQRIAFLEAKRAERVGMTADDVLRELAVLGTSDVRHYEMGEHGIELAEGAPEVAMRAVQSVKRKVRRIHKEDGPDEEIEEVEYKLWNKPAALRMAGEYHKLFVQKVENLPPSPSQTVESGEVVMNRLLQMIGRALLAAPAAQRLAVLGEIERAEVVSG